MKKRSVDTIKIIVKPEANPLHSLLYGATVKDGVYYSHLVYINDECIWGDGVSIADFEAMLEKPGDYWPFFCSYCGEPADAGIFFPIRCFHRGDQLVLVIRDPLQDVCVSCDEYSDCPLGESDSAYECPKRSPLYHAHIIQKEQLRQQLFELRKEFGSNLDRC